MEIVLLGTGAADGWPNPFCTCASCDDATRRGEIRGQTAALIDDVLLLECGPEAPRAALRHGRNLAGVRHILLTHAHVDHLGPQALLFRSWAEAGFDIDVVGPAAAIDACRPWVGPGDPVRFVPVAAGDALNVGGYRIRVLGARHRVFDDGDAVLYDVAGPSCARILWACDTGPLPESWFDAVHGAAFDAVFLEETFGDRADLGDDHHTLAAFADTVAALRACGAVGDGTDVIAVHLGHHNPPIAQVRRRLAECGARAGYDGEVIGVGATSNGGGRTTLILGGVRSGKSRYAEQLLEPCPSVTYVATGDTREGDAEWASRTSARIVVHRRDIRCRRGSAVGHRTSARGLSRHVAHRAPRSARGVDGRGSRGGRAGRRGVADGLGSLRGAGCGGEQRGGQRGGPGQCVGAAVPGFARSAQREGRGELGFGESRRGGYPAATPLTDLSATRRDMFMPLVVCHHW